MASPFLGSASICARCKRDRLTVNSRLSFVRFGCVPAVVALRLYWESLVPICGMAGHGAYWRLFHCALRIMPWMPFLSHCVSDEGIKSVFVSRVCYICIS